MNARSNRITGGLLTALLFLGAQRAAAHDDPPGCTSEGFASGGVAVFRADGVTPIGANESIGPCETIQYQVSVQYRTGTNDCGFQGGSMILQTPDGIFHDTTP